jgi:hypothetical protein
MYKLVLFYSFLRIIGYTIMTISKSFRFVTKSTLLHLRFPFSYFLMPVYMLALAVSPAVNVWNAVWIFIVLHFLVFPASHGFNSYYDRDEQSIGGLARPPKVTPELLSVSLALDALALVFAFMVHPVFAGGCFVYGLASKAYSWDKTRVKRYPVAGWLFTGIGQGSVVFAMVLLCVIQPDFTRLLEPSNTITIALAGLFILGCYPLTQVYQHAEDRRRGDRTISVMLGIRGTFLLSGPLLFVAILGFFFYFLFFDSFGMAIVFALSLSPAAIYLIAWTILVFVDERKANFRLTMGMNFIAATCVNLFSLIAIFQKLS